MRVKSKNYSKYVPLLQISFFIALWTVLATGPRMVKRNTAELETRSLATFLILITTIV
jgi:hypothetical protein